MMGTSNERNLLNKAWSLYQKGQYQSALQVVRKVLQSNPSSEQGWLLLSYFVREDRQKTVYCLRKVLSINPSNQKARRALAKYQQGRTGKHPQKQGKSQDNEIPQWVVDSMLGAALLLLIVVIVLLVSLNTFVSSAQPQRSVRPITLPPTWTPQVPTSTSTPALITGEPLDYVPILPDQFEVDYSLPQGEKTLDDGTKLLTIGFKNTRALFHGDLVSVIYFIQIYPTEAKAITIYHNYISDLESGEGTVDSGIGIDGADQSAIRIKREGDNVFSVEMTSRVKNTIITTTGLTAYDPQEVTDSFIKGVIAEVAKVHILGIDKLSK